MDVSESAETSSRAFAAPVIPGAQVVLTPGWAKTPALASSLMADTGSVAADVLNDGGRGLNPGNPGDSGYPGNAGNSVNQGDTGDSGDTGVDEGGQVVQARAGRYAKHDVRYWRERVKRQVVNGKVSGNSWCG